MPYRPSSEISQSFTTGVVKIYAVTDEAEPGFQPKEKPVLKETLLYEERALGITRIYQSRQAMAEVERVIRVQRRPVSPQDLAVTEDKRQYRIETVQDAAGIWPPSLDLALRKTEQDFEGL